MDLGGMYAFIKPTSGSEMVTFTPVISLREEKEDKRGNDTLLLTLFLYHYPEESTRADAINTDPPRLENNTDFLCMLGANGNDYEQVKPK